MFFRKNVNKQKVVEHYVDNAISELGYLRSDNKTKEARVNYLNNAIRYLKIIKENLE